MTDEQHLRALLKRREDNKQPYWAGKDVVGYLLQMGWAVHMDGMRKGGKFIPEASIIGADVSSLQKEVAQRLAKWTTHREEQP